MLQGCFKIIEKSRLSADVHDITVHAPEAAAQAKAGQFAHIRCGDFPLRRPISLCEVDKIRGTLRFVAQERGAGTRVLGTLKQGDALDMMVPLGNGFALLGAERRAVFVGGGIGVPPLLQAAKHYEKPRVLLGFRSRADVILQADFEQAAAAVQIATDDGSAGHHGYVPVLLEALLQQEGADIIYSCGPLPMQRAVAELARRFGIRCQLSLEERMACGVGGCLVCVCKTKTDGVTANVRVCREGPVFEAAEVEWDG